MLDNRIYTFIELCRTMNYRKAAENLNISQPAVTQHIQYLQMFYQCQLFEYNGRVLTKTKEAEKLEGYALSAIYNEKQIKKELVKVQKTILNIGVTKTIGDYVIFSVLSKISNDEKYTLNVTVDNTKQLLDLLNQGKVDIAIIEGSFDKDFYGYKLFRLEDFHGFCSKEHIFANKQIEMSYLWDEKLILREEGSGTRMILKQVLETRNYSFDNFKDFITLNSFSLIEDFVSNNQGITFAYDSFGRNNSQLRPFYIKDYPIKREFNIVYLKNAMVDQLLKYF